MKKASCLILICLALLFIIPATALGDPKIYWHFTFKAFVDVPSTTAVEWAWVTMVEIDRAAVFPEQAAAARSQGGRFDGIFFAQVRAAAWRSEHRYFRNTKCKGKPAQHEVFWSETESESVYCHGMLYPSQPYRGQPGEPPARLDMFRFGFTNRRVLHENGRYEDLTAQPQVFLGGIQIVGGESEETKGGFNLQVVNYIDNIEHHRRCGKAWVEQYKPAFDHFHHESLQSDLMPVGDYGFGQVPFGPSDRNNIVWQVERSHDREHPHWKRQEM